MERRYVHCTYMTNSIQHCSLASDSVRSTMSGEARLVSERETEHAVLSRFPFARSIFYFAMTLHRNRQLSPTYRDRYEQHGHDSASWESGLVGQVPPSSLGRSGQRRCGPVSYGVVNIERLGKTRTKSCRLTKKAYRSEPPRILP